MNSNVETDFKTILGKLDQIDPIKYGSSRNYIDGAVTYLLPFISRGVINTKQVLESVLKKGHKISQIAAFLKELYYPFCKAPFVKDAIIKIAMKLEEIIPISMNGTILIAESNIKIEIEETMVGSDGFVALCEADVLISLGHDAYFVSKPIGGVPYAKP